MSREEEAAELNLASSQRYPWYKESDYFSRCLEENRSATRITLMAYDAGDLAGCCHLLFASDYPPFYESRIPEINDLNVFPEHRRKGIAGLLFDELERIASSRYDSIGLGVGLYSDYGNAQRMYGKRGYKMDGRGIVYRNREVKPGEQVTVDDDLLIYLVKSLTV